MPTKIICTSPVTLISFLANGVIIRPDAIPIDPVVPTNIYLRIPNTLPYNYFDSLFYWRKNQPTDHIYGWIGPFAISTSSWKAAELYENLNSL